MLVRYYRHTWPTYLPRSVWDSCVRAHSFSILLKRLKSPTCEPSRRRCKWKLTLACWMSKQQKFISNFAAEKLFQFQFVFFSFSVIPVDIKIMNIIWNIFFRYFRKQFWKHFLQTKIVRQNEFQGLVQILDSVLEDICVDLDAARLPAGLAVRLSLVQRPIRSVGRVERFDPSSADHLTSRYGTFIRKSP